MAKLFLVHWHGSEAEAIAATLREAGHQVAVHASVEARAAFGEGLPDALVISLQRLPSHGCAIAEWFWEAKKRRTLPILFAGGAAPKVEATRARFPDARFCAMDDLVEEVARCLAPP